MLVTKTVKALVNGGTQAYYRARGYTIPVYWCKIHKKWKVKHPTYIEVAVTDLKRRSDILVEWKCDLCSRSTTAPYKNYTQCHEHAAIDRCIFCWTACFKEDKTKHPHYNPNLDPSIRRNRRMDAKEKKWRASVYERDNYTCQHCKKRGGDLNAHHIKSYHAFPEYRYDLDNGITLCIPCHRQEHRRLRAQ